MCPETGELHFSKHRGEPKKLGFWGKGELYMGLYIWLTMKQISTANIYIFLNNRGS